MDGSENSRLLSGHQLLARYQGLDGRRCSTAQLQQLQAKGVWSGQLHQSRDAAWPSRASRGDPTCCSLQPCSGAFV